MSMSDYEPASGWNLPPGCFEGDPRDPWNQPDPWVGRRCGECEHCRRCSLSGGGSTSVCAADLDCLEEIDPEDEACEGFE